MFGVQDRTSLANPRREFALLRLAVSCFLREVSAPTASKAAQMNRPPWGGDAIFLRWARERLHVRTNSLGFLDTKDICI